MKDKCPYCGKEFTRLSVHLKYCKAKKEVESQELYMDEVVEELCCEEEEVPFVPDKPCPFLVIIRGDTCSSCRGTSCMASDDKKISDAQYCEEEWPECLTYEVGRDTGMKPVCPYFGYPPEDVYCCSGIYCYARKKAVKVVKSCRGWHDCGNFLQAKSDGVQFHRAKVI